MNGGATNEQTLRAPLPGGVLPMAGVLALTFLSSALIHPMLDQLVRQPFGLDNALTGWFMIAGVAAGLVAAPLGAWWSDRRARRVPLIAIGAAGAGLCIAALPIAPTFSLLLAANFGHGAFSTLAICSILTRGADLGAAGGRARIFALLGAAIPVGYLVAPALTYRFGEHHAALLFGCVGLILILSALPQWLEFSRPEPQAAARLESSTSINDDLVPQKFPTSFWLLPVLFGVLDKISFGVIAILTALVMKDSFGAEDPRMASLAHLCFWIGFIAACVPAGRITQRSGALKPMAVGSLGYGVVFAALGAAPSSGAFIALMTLCGALSAFMHIPCMSIVGELSPAGRRGMGMSIFNITGTLGMLAGIGMAGALSDDSHAMVYGIAGGFKILTGFAAMLYLAARLRLPQLASKALRTKRCDQ